MMSSWPGCLPRVNSYITIRPEQIKSATGNQGSFDPEDPRINYAKFKEELHPRDSDGKFGEGSGGTAAATPELPSANSVSDIDDAQKRAAAGGFSGFFVDEGKGEPNSVFFLEPIAGFRGGRNLSRGKEGETITLYRGSSTTSPKRGHYYTTDKEWSRQFTQSGHDDEIRSIVVSLSDLMDDRKGASDQKEQRSNPDTPEFKHWFGDSKVVDKSGEPLVVYHGTDRAVTEFDTTRGKQTQEQHASAALGTYFTDNPDVANIYTGLYKQSRGEGGNIIPAYISIKNPYLMPVAEMMGVDTFPKAAAKRRGLLKKGYDGIIQQGEDGNADMTQIVAFEPTQIKSATGNKGSFDPDDPRMTYSKWDESKHPRDEAGRFGEGGGTAVAEKPRMRTREEKKSSVKLPLDISADEPELPSGRGTPEGRDAFEQWMDDLEEWKTAKRKIISEAVEGATMAVFTDSFPGTGKQAGHMQRRYLVAHKSTQEPDRPWQLTQFVPELNEAKPKQLPWGHTNFVTLEGAAASSMGVNEDGDNNGSSSYRLTHVVRPGEPAPKLPFSREFWQEVERFAKQQTLWDEKEHPRDADGKFSESSGQKRAKVGGEIGANGEWYPGGAFIATTDMPKKARDKRARAASGKVLVEPGKPYEVPEPGKVSIASLLDPLYDWKKKELNIGAVNYYANKDGKFTDEWVAGLHELGKRYANGDRWADATDFPYNMQYGDMARMAEAGMEIAGAAIENGLANWPGDVTERLGITYTPAAKQPEEKKIDIDSLEDELLKQHDSLEVLNITEGDLYVKLHSIRMKEGQRGGGAGSEVIKALQDYATKQGKPIVLDAQPEPRKKAALNKFYRSHGFKKPGRSRDYRLPAGHTHIWRPENYSRPRMYTREDYAKQAMLWKEELHPRDADGKFGEGGGGASTMDKDTLQKQFTNRGDEFWGIEETPDGSVFSETDYSGTQCTGYACMVAKKLGLDRVKQFGFDERAGTGGLIEEKLGGHDFAVVDDRFIVDPWLTEVESGQITTRTGNVVDAQGQTVFDMENPGDKQAIDAFYGDKSKWDRNTAVEEDLRSAEPGGDHDFQGAELRDDPILGKALHQNTPHDPDIHSRHEWESEMQDKIDDAVAGAKMLVFARPPLLEGDEIEEWAEDANAYYYVAHKSTRFAGFQLSKFYIASTNGEPVYVSPTSHTTYESIEEAAYAAMGVDRRDDDVGGDDVRLYKAFKPGDDAKMPFSRVGMMTRQEREDYEKQGLLWKETDHPRDEGGQFSEKDGGSSFNWKEGSPELHKQDKGYRGSGPATSWTRTTNTRRRIVEALDDLAETTKWIGSTKKEKKDAQDTYDALSEVLPKVLFSFSPKSLDRIEAKAQRWIFHRNVQALSKRNKIKANGCWVWWKSKNWGQLHLTSAGIFSGSGHGIQQESDSHDDAWLPDTTEGVAAHEITHAIDIHDTYSKTKEWREAWNEEIVDNREILWQYDDDGLSKPFDAQFASDLEVGDWVRIGTPTKRAKKDRAVNDPTHKGSKIDKITKIDTNQHGTPRFHLDSGGHFVRKGRTHVAILNKQQRADPPKLTFYASKNYSEGFAEFGRQIIADPKYAKENFPKCYQFWLERELVEE